MWQTSPAGPFNAWPTGGGGFEYFYGFIGGENNQWDPALYEGTTPIEPPKTPAEGYHLTEDLTDKAIDWTRQQKALLPRQAVLHVLRAGRHPRAASRARRSGSTSTRASSPTAGTSSARSPSSGRRNWASSPPTPCSPRATRRFRPGMTWIPSSSRCWSARWRCTPRSWSTPTITSAGCSTRSGLDVLDDTLIYLIIGDNGASAEGTLQGAFNEMANFNGMAAIETPEFMMSKLDEFGGEGSYGHYAVGWAWAMDSPYQWTKQVASHWGGTRNGTIVHWPNGIKEKGGMRNQFSHVIDLAPDRAGSGRHSRADDGQRRACRARTRARACCTASTTPKAPERHETQYFEMFCNRGIYHKGWSAVTKHRTPWEMGGAEDARLRRRRLGALRRQQGLDAGQRPVEEDAREAARAAAAVADRGGQVQRAPARRPADRALQSRDWPAGPR